MSEKMARLDKSVIDMVYPVGAIYMSVNSTNPGNLFGGKWEQIKDRFMLACGDTYAAGSTGGEAQHTLTVDEMPAHSHGVKTNSNEGDTEWQIGDIKCSKAAKDLTFQWEGRSVSITGGSQPHNNMPPYLSVYMWQRVS